MGDNVHNLFNTVASVLPGNENNRAFATDHSKSLFLKRSQNHFIDLLTSTQGPSQNTPNIQLSSKPQDEQNFESKKNCSC